MPPVTRSIGTILLAGAMMLSSGCAFLRGSAAGSSFVNGDMWHLRLPGAHDSGPNAVGYRSPFGYEEYDRSTAHGRAEAMFLLARQPGISLDISSDRLESLTRQWNFNRRGARLAWSQARKRKIAGTSITYRLYRRRGQKSPSARACVAFIRGWAIAPDDPYFRPTRAYFGYYCRPPSQSLSVATAEDYLRHIEVASSSLPRFYIGQQVPRDAAARSRARGVSSPNWGINAYPLHRFRHYPVGGPHGGGGGSNN